MLLTVQMLIGDVPGLGHVQGQTVSLKSFPFALRIATGRRQTLGRSPQAVAPAYDVLAETFRIETSNRGRHRKIRRQRSR